MSISLESTSESTQFQPTVEQALFKNVPEARFWVGMVASDDKIVLPGIYKAARVFRANSYIDDNHFLPASARQDDGGEMDADDWRSTHFVAVRNDGESAQIAGNIRSILKRTEKDLLPVEKHFPEVFIDAPAPVGAGEASRFIATDTDKLVQSAIAAGLVRSILMHAFNQSTEPVYAIIEAPLERRFRTLGLPFENIAPPKQLEEYGNTLNLGIKFEPKEIIRVTEEDINEERLITKFIKTAYQNDGLGFYDDYLLTPMEG